MAKYLEQRVGTGSNQQLIDHGLTNLGLFRGYILDYLKQREDIRNDMYVIVRQLSPTAEGLPIEIYCFTSNVFGRNMKKRSRIFLSLCMPLRGISNWGYIRSRRVLM